MLVNVDTSCRTGSRVHPNSSEDNFPGCEADHSHVCVYCQSLQDVACYQMFVNHLSQYVPKWNEEM
jgi:hypothetical protein